MKARFEFKREDCWIGVYWRESYDVVYGPRKGVKGRANFVNVRVYGMAWTDIWLCLVPCLPLHITTTRRTVPLRDE